MITRIDSRIKNILPRGSWAGPNQEGPKDLSQSVHVQAIAGLSLGNLGQVCQEVLQGEAVMDGDGCGVLKDQTHHSVMATRNSSI